MGDVKTTVEIPDELFRRSKATAALRGESLKDFLTAALRAHLKEREPGDDARQHGWRSVFGQALREEVAEIDAIITQELERVEPEEWR